MVHEREDRPNTHHWPPIIYAITLTLAWLLSRWLPWPAWRSGVVLWSLGGALIVAGLAVIVAALLHFWQIGTTFNPTGPATALATRGIYRFSRNPMYLGVIVAFAGLGVALALPWLLVLLPGMTFALRRLAIDREEAYLARRFGRDYEDYKQKVRRWI